MLFYFGLFVMIAVKSGLVDQNFGIFCVINKVLARASVTTVDNFSKRGLKKNAIRLRTMVDLKCDYLINV